MRILHITDTHGTARTPESRTDIYYISFLRKFYELGYVIKKAKVDMVIHTGDLFHSARVSNKFAGYVAEIMKSWNVPIYVVPGNHDIEGYSKDTLEQSTLGLFAKAQVVKLLDRDYPLTIDCGKGDQQFTIAISGQEYYAHIDEGNPADFEMQQDTKDLNILCYHGWLTNKPTMAEIKHTEAKDVNTDADIILCGHFHESYEFEIGDTSVYNPGSMMRVERNEYNRKNRPKYGILDIALDKNGNISYDYNFHEFKSAADSASIFDYTQAMKEKTKAITLETFKQNLELGIASISNASGVENVLNALPDDAVKKNALKLYSDALQNMPDTYDVKQGYQQDTKVKYISKVIIKNFQSHTDTTVEFSNGLNVILGESNNGKTVILRAITWVLDNYPLGTDFITAGKNECSVTVEYSDGTSITRKRSRKGDSGSYEVHIFNPMTNTWEDNVYKGFTNAVPVEIDNVHQMPKVSITKNLETHLNMMSQLDEPFLITASPQDKSAAIGRITGVHIADAAVSEANKAIRNDKQAIQVNSVNIQNMKDAVSKLPDLNRLKQMEVLSNAVVDYVHDINNMITHINSTLSDIQAIDNDIAVHNAKLRFYKRQASLSTVVDKVVDNVNHLKELATSYLSALDFSRHINDMYRMLNKYRAVADTSSFIFGLANEVRKTLDIRSCIDNINKIDVQHINTMARRDLINEWTQYFNAIITDAMSKCSYLKGIAPEFNACSAIDGFINITSEQLGKAEAEKGKAVKELATQKKKISSEILKNGICPCCKQPVTKEHADNILEFIGGN